jgi:hypothetical protein
MQVPAQNVVILVVMAVVFGGVVVFTAGAAGDGLRSCPPGGPWWLWRCSPGWASATAWPGRSA